MNRLLLFFFSSLLVLSFSVKAETQAVFVTGITVMNPNSASYALLLDQISNCMYVAGIKGDIAIAEKQSCILDDGSTTEIDVYLKGRVVQFPIQPGDAITLRLAAEES